MQELVRKAMRQGALGVASSLSGPPGAWIDTETLIALCKAASEFGGIYSTHMRSEGQGVNPWPRRSKSGAMPAKHL